MSTPNGTNDKRVQEILERALYLFAGDEEALQRWLQRPDPQLGNMKPQQAIDTGQLEAVAFIIESALQGNPD